MKRADLKVGQEYWYSRNNDWLERESAGQKLVVVDTGFWRLPTYSMWDRDRSPRQDTKGNGVLVDITVQSFRKGEPETIKRTVVNLTQIRGPYEETLLKVREFDAKRRERLAKAEALRDATAARIQQAITEAADLGFKAKRAGYQLDEISLPTEEFFRLLSMINR